jgi:hypothetical protein
VHEERAPAPACWRAFWGKDTISANFVKHIDKIVNEEIGKDIQIPDIVFPADTGFPEFLVSLGQFCAKNFDGYNDRIDNIMDLFWRSCNLENNIKKSSSNGRAFMTTGFSKTKGAWFVESDDNNSAIRPHIADYVNFRQRPPISIYLQETPQDIYLIKSPELWIIPVPAWNRVSFILQEKEQFERKSNEVIVVVEFSYIAGQNISCSNINKLLEELDSVGGNEISDLRNNGRYLDGKKERASVDGYSLSGLNRWTIKVISLDGSHAESVSIFKMRKGRILTTADNFAVAIRIAALNLALGR